MATLGFSTSREISEYNFLRHTSVHCIKETRGKLTSLGYIKAILVKVVGSLICGDVFSGGVQLILRKDGNTVWIQLRNNGA